ncbi:MAG TPA: hypothetical protein VK439_04775, partial [Rubrivivax sp.]|nr:hypothetical protein [Rubrivivax sp.]
MSENESFFRKVVRFVANPATDWTELNSRQEDTKELELEKSELKAMIERKRRNDFVRKREFDMLRKVRREGLSPEQLAALGTSSRLDDSDARRSDDRNSRLDGVKAKIDEIEQQMVGEGGFTSTRSKAFGSAQNTTQKMPLAPPPQPAASADRLDDDEDDELPPLPPLPAVTLAPSAAPAPVQMSGGLPPLAPMAAVS